MIYSSFKTVFWLLDFSFSLKYASYFKFIIKTKFIQIMTHISLCVYVDGRMCVHVLACLTVSLPINSILVGNVLLQQNHYDELPVL